MSEIDILMDELLKDVEVNVAAEARVMPKFGKQAKDNFERIIKNNFERIIENNFERIIENNFEKIFN